MKHFFIIFSLLILSWGTLMADNQTVYDKVTLACQSHSQEPMPELVVRIAKQLLGTPYVGGTLEQQPEQLRVYLDKTDCILFVETCTAWAQTLKADRPSLDLLKQNIQQMRYRKGVINGYASRIHYTSEWVLQNQQRGVLTELTHQIGGVKHPQVFSFMSTHPQYYPALADAAQLKQVKATEQRLTAEAPYYKLTQAQLRDPKIASQIRTGDIIAFISPKQGLDLSHVAIAYWDRDRLTFIHASSRAKKVIIEPTSLADYATNGIRIFRLN